LQAAELPLNPPKAVDDLLLRFAIHV
jgi:hypothetical protein